MRPPDLVLIGPTTVSRPTGECRSQDRPACHSKDKPQGVSRFAGQTEPQEPTKHRFQRRLSDHRVLRHDHLQPRSRPPRNELRSKHQARSPEGTIPLCDDATCSEFGGHTIRE